MELLINLIFQGLAMLPPVIQKAVTGGRTLEEALADTEAELAKYKTREGPDGKWADIDAEGKKRG